MSEQEPMVTVIMATFNQERYVEEAVRSIAAQKVDFPVEVLVGDDASTDDTQKVLARLRDEFAQTPSNIHFNFLLREQNMGELGERNNEDMLHRARGKYLAITEGDDFWTYEYKLQLQVEFLEAHPEYSACFHRCQVVGADSQPNGEKYPECPREEYSFDEFFYMSLPGQLGTSMVRREPFMAARDDFMAHKLYDSYPGDRRNAFFLLTLGKVRCLPEVWSAYRHIVKDSSSYSSTVRVNESYARNEILFARTLVEFAERHHHEEALRCAKLTYYRLFLKWSRRMPETFSRKQCLEELSHERGRLALRTSYIRWYAVLAARQLTGHGVTL